MPAGWIEQPTSSLRVTRSTTELSGLHDCLTILQLSGVGRLLRSHASILTVTRLTALAQRSKPILTHPNRGTAYLPIPDLLPPFRKFILYTMAAPTKTETDQIFTVLKAGKGNKVRDRAASSWVKIANHASRCVSIVKPAIRRGPALPLACTFVSIALACTVTWACMSLLFGMPRSALLKFTSAPAT
jgi:hypothetical protein